MSSMSGPIGNPLPLALQPKSERGGNALQHIKDPDGVARAFVREILSSSGGQPAWRVAAVVERKVQGRSIGLESVRRERGLGWAERKLMKRRRGKITGLRAREKKASKAFYVGPEHAVYAQYEPLHALWRQYIADLTAGANNAGAFEAQLVKADLHGASVKVVEARSVSMVGIEGLLVQETENTFKVVTAKNEFKTVPKANTVFEISAPSPVLGDCRVQIFGSSIVFRSAERTARKHKGGRSIYVY